MSSGGGTNPISTYYLARNWVVFMRRNARSKQFITYVVYSIFIQIPFGLAMHVKHKRFNCILPHIKGTLSGMRWVIENRKGGENN
jgi:hypothetical protein